MKNPEIAEMIAMASPNHGVSRQPKLRSGHWFAPRRYGYGATPATWQGWFVTAVMLALTWAVASFAQHRGSMVLLLLLVPLIAGFAWLSWRKTDGAWRWRWGARD
jgi:hypothetical protein